MPDDAAPFVGFADELQRKAPSPGDIDQLRTKLAADPADAQARFDLALALNAKGDRSALQPAAVELVGKKVNVIFTTGTRATEVAKAATKDIPIVFRHPADPVAVGLLKNMKRPEGNVTGVAAFSSDTDEKRLAMLKLVVPQLRRVHIFYDANNMFSANNLSAFRKAAAKLQLEVVNHPVKTGAEIQTALDNLQAQEGDAIFQIADALVESNAGPCLSESAMWPQEPAWSTSSRISARFSRTRWKSSDLLRVLAGGSLTWPRRLTTSIRP